MSAGLCAEQIEMWEYWSGSEADIQFDKIKPAPDEAPKLDTSKLSISRLPAIFAETMGQTPNPSLSSKLIMEEYAEWYETLGCAPLNKEGDVAELKELADLVYVVYGYANVMGWDLDEAIRRVHDNNMGRCIQPDGSIKRREDGKILKNKGFPKVELRDLV